VPDHPDSGEVDYDRPGVYRMTLHELGHALGLGHALPLEESLDIMGYGWKPARSRSSADHLYVRHQRPSASSSGGPSRASLPTVPASDAMVLK